MIAVASAQSSDRLTGYVVEHQPLLYISALLLGPSPVKLLSKTSNPGWENFFSNCSTRPTRSSHQ